MKALLYTVALLMVHLIAAQNDIKTPSFTDIDSEIFINNHISIAVDVKGTIFLEGEKVALNMLEPKLFQTLYKKTKQETLDFFFYTELIIDKDTPYTKLRPLLKKLRALHMRVVFFASEVSVGQKTPYKKVTGISYKLNSLKNSTFLMGKVLDSINAEKETSKAALSNIPPPPPPPPLPAEITPKLLRDKKYNTKVIHVQRGVSVVDGEKLSAMKLTEKLLSWNAKDKVAYLLQIDDNATYQDVLTPIASLKKAIKVLRNQKSLKKYDKPFEELDYFQNDEIRAEIPFIILFDE
jgi:biopolymer transport protein ExbD